MDIDNDKKEVLDKSGKRHKKIIILFILFVLVCIGGAGAAYYFFSVQNLNLTEKDSQIQQLLQDNEKLRSINKPLEEKLTKLSTDYDRIYKDRENVIEQSKRIIQEKNELLNIKESFEELSGEKERLLQEKEKIAGRLNESEEAVGRLEETLKNYESELIEKKKLLKEYATEEEQVVEESSMEGVDFRKPEVTLRALKKENINLSDSLEDINKELDNIKKNWEETESDYKKEAQASQKRYDELHNMHEDLLAEYHQVVREYELLQVDMDKFPSKFAALANQNEKLIEETAKMHYNLGVFYFKESEYQRSIPEFERAIKLDPKDAGSYYYLGHIYAERLGRHREAIEYFKKHLQLAPHSVHSDWVKKYMLSRQAWDGEIYLE